MRVVSRRCREGLSSTQDAKLSCCMYHHHRRRRQQQQQRAFCVNIRLWMRKNRKRDTERRFTVNNDSRERERESQIEREKEKTRKIDKY